MAVRQGGRRLRRGAVALLAGLDLGTETLAAAGDSVGPLSGLDLGAPALTAAAVAGRPGDLLIGVDLGTEARAAGAGVYLTRVDLGTETRAAAAGEHSGGDLAGVEAAHAGG